MLQKMKPSLASCWFLSFVVVGCHAGLEHEVEMTPPPPDFSKYFEALPQLGRKVVVASPCIGISGSGHAFHQMHTGAIYNNVFDLEPRYRECLTKHMTSVGLELHEIELHLGKTRGDLLLLPLKNLKVPVDFLIAGPPCPPWAGNGNQKSLRDVRARVFVRVMMWVLFLVKCGGLLAVVLENVAGILQSFQGQEPAMTQFLRVLHAFIPEFAFRVDTLDLRDYLCPQGRVRVFLRGLRRSILEAVPAPLKRFGTRTLRDVLGSFPNVLRSSLTLPQQDNLRVYEQMITTKVLGKCLELADVVVMHLDRNPHNEYGTTISRNISPTLTCKNNYLLIMSVSDVFHQVADAGREFFRFMHATERLTLQGFPPRLILDLGSSILAVKASGNAYPVPLIIATVHPLIEAIGTKECFDFESWPLPEMISDKTPDCMELFSKALVAKSRKLKGARKKSRQELVRRSACPKKKKRGWGDSD